MTELFPWQQTLWQHVVSRVEQQRIPHAVLLTGVAGLGKTLFAAKMAESLLCQSPDEQFMACGHCHSCQLMQAGNHPDHLTICAEEAGKSIKIEQIRALKEKQSLTPSIAKWKTVIIEAADSMTNSAANSLLKLLEEPQNNTILILTTEAVHRLPVTIRSRCQQMHLPTPDYSITLPWLDSQGISTDTDQLQQLASLTLDAPFAIVHALETNEWQSYQQLQQDFDQLLQQRANPVQMANQWQQYDLLKVMHQLLSTIKTRLKLHYSGYAEVTKAQQYWQIVDCIVNTIKLVSSSNNYNKTLLIEDFMVSVMRISNTNSVNH
ncbi:DNA polymerase III subunit delta' [Methylophaga muralis]|uniref:DNA-directed DNA polymerase n=1 Tax=Methylophaga muralis TaxID=291169 RepID=A0A1E3GTV3_9GAMM|nr:DNA polymerase III subunit delta' [Methylophaga muralis]ODN67467.1 DNA polymerase III subunit delta' [Methylophaga muralis]